MEKETNIVKSISESLKASPGSILQKYRNFLVKNSNLINYLGSNYLDFFNSTKSNNISETEINDFYSKFKPHILLYELIEKLKEVGSEHYSTKIRRLEKGFNIPPSMLREFLRSEFRGETKDKIITEFLILMDEEFKDNRKKHSRYSSSIDSDGKMLLSKDLILNYKLKNNKKQEVLVINENLYLIKDSDIIKVKLKNEKKSNLLELSKLIKLNENVINFNGSEFSLDENEENENNKEFSDFVKNNKKNFESNKEILKITIPEAGMEINIIKLDDKFKAIIDDKHNGFNDIKDFDDKGKEEISNLMGKDGNYLTNEINNFDPNFLNLKPSKMNEEEPDEEEETNTDLENTDLENTDLEDTDLEDTDLEDSDSDSTDPEINTNNEFIDSETDPIDPDPELIDPEKEKEYEIKKEQIEDRIEKINSLLQNIANLDPDFQNRMDIKETYLSLKGQKSILEEELDNLLIKFDDSNINSKILKDKFNININESIDEEQFINVKKRILNSKNLTSTEKLNFVDLYENLEKSLINSGFNNKKAFSGILEISKEIPKIKDVLKIYESEIELIEGKKYIINGKEAIYMGEDEESPEPYLFQIDGFVETFKKIPLNIKIYEKKDWKSLKNKIFSYDIENKNFIENLFEIFNSNENNKIDKSNNIINFEDETNYRKFNDYLNESIEEKTNQKFDFSLDYLKEPNKLNESKSYLNFIKSKKQIDNKTELIDNKLYFLLEKISINNNSKNNIFEKNSILKYNKIYNVFLDDMGNEIDADLIKNYVSNLEGLEPSKLEEGKFYKFKDKDIELNLIYNFKTLDENLDDVYNFTSSLNENLKFNEKEIRLFIK